MRLNGESQVPTRHEDGRALSFFDRRKSHGHGSFGVSLEIYRATLNMMVVLRHLVGSDPSIEFADEESIGNAAVTQHFNAQPPKAARRIEPEKRSVVINEAQSAKMPMGVDPADVTQVTRPRGASKWLTASHWLILFETNWVVFVIGLSVLGLLVCAVRLRQI